MAHNVVAVDGRTQVAVAGEFGYLWWPDAALVAAADHDAIALVAVTTTHMSVLGWGATAGYSWFLRTGCSWWTGFPTRAGRMRISPVFCEAFATMTTERLPEWHRVMPMVYWLAPFLSLPNRAILVGAAQGQQRTVGK